MRALLLFTVAICVAGNAEAEPSPEAACDYFAQSMNVVPDQNGTQFLEAIWPEFEHSRTNLERYSTYVRSTHALPIESPRLDGRTIVIGFGSATEACVVDVKERRVLLVSVGDGPEVGATIEHEGKTLEIVGVTETSVDIGLMSHEGRY